MSELKEIAAILFRNLSDALLTKATQLSAQKTFTKANLDTKMVEKPEFVSLNLGDFVMISFIYRKRDKRYWGHITNIEGEQITVSNTLIEEPRIVAIENILYKEVPSLRN